MKLNSNELFTDRNRSKNTFLGVSEPSDNEEVTVDVLLSDHVKFGSDS